MEAIWFNSMLGTVGIVMYENEVGQKKAYIGIGDGLDEGYDIHQIKTHGAKLTLSQVKQIEAHLNNPEIK